MSCPSRSHAGRLFPAFALAAPAASPTPAMVHPATHHATRSR